MGLLLFLGGLAAVALLGMVLIGPWLERLRWERDFASRTYSFLRAATQ